MSGPAEGCLAIIFAFLLGGVMAYGIWDSISEWQLHDDMVKAGRGEYYLDEQNNKQFRYLDSCLVCEEKL